MSCIPQRRFVTVAAAVAITLGGVLACAAPASATDVDPTPIRVIGGDLTGITNPNAVVPAPDGMVFATDIDTASILGFAPGAAGNIAPTIDIHGPKSDLLIPYGMKRDSGGDLWVTNWTTPNASILEFAPGATGNVQPIRVITGVKTQLDKASDLAIGPDDRIYVTNEGSAAVLVFAANASGDATPERVISGSNTGFVPGDDPTGISLLPNGSIVVSTHDSVETFSANASGNATPLRVISGPNTGLDFTIDLAIDRTGTLYTANNVDGSVSEFPETAYGNVAPSPRIIGTDSDVTGAEAVAVDDDDNLYVGTDSDDNPASIVEFPANLAVTGVSPGTGLTSGGQVVAVHGFGFTSGATVTVDGRAATNVLVRSSTLITAVVPAHSAGRADVAVTEDATSATAADAFTYVAALATTGVDPVPGIAVSAVLLGAGSALFLARRRTARRQPTSVP